MSISDSYAWDTGVVYTFDIKHNDMAYSGAAPLPFDTPVDPDTFHAHVPCGQAASGSYYVNDDSTTGDVYSTTPGDDSNDGLTPNTPKRSLQALLLYYTLKGGDVVRVDTGVHPVTQPTTIDYHDRERAASLYSSSALRHLQSRLSR